MTDLKEKMSKQVARVEGSEHAPATVADMLKQPNVLAELGRALPNGWDPERFSRIAMTAIMASPKLMECEARSVIGAVLLAAQLNLELSGPLGHAFLVPYKGKASFQLGYKGIVALALRSDKMQSIETRIVYQNDTFAVEYGVDGKLVHIPCLEGERGPAMFYYAVAKFTNGGSYFEVMNKADIERHREMSQRPDSPAWVGHFDTMARKTVVRSMAPYLPLTAIAEKGIAQDDTVHSIVSEDILDLPPEDVIGVEDAEVSA